MDTFPEGYDEEKEDQISKNLFINCYKILKAEDEEEKKPKKK